MLLPKRRCAPCAITPNIYLDEHGDKHHVCRCRFSDRGQVPLAAGIDVTFATSPTPAADASVDAARRAARESRVSRSPAKPGEIERYVLWYRDRMRTAPQAFDTQQTTYVNVRTLPADSNLADPNQLQPTWDNVQANVLKNWQAMAPCMDNWLDLGNPEQVKSFAPLLQQADGKGEFRSVPLHARRARYDRGPAGPALRISRRAAAATRNSRQSAAAAVAATVEPRHARDLNARSFATVARIRGNPETPKYRSVSMWS